LIIKSQNRQVAWNNRPDITARPRRRDHRVIGGCPLLALSGHAELHCTCPLSGVKRTFLFALQMSAFDPKRTFEVQSMNVR
jgi:hypothetical protein